MQTRAVLIIVVLIVYGSLYPFIDWRIPPQPLFSFLVTPPALERADLLQNVLVYMPLGLMLVWRSPRERAMPTTLVIASLLGLLLSFSIESIQQFLPSRVASISDIAMNLSGTALGGLVALFMRVNTKSGNTLHGLRARLIRPGAAAEIGIVVLCMWALSQTCPLIPSLDVAHMRHGLALLKQAYLQPEVIDMAKLYTYTCYLSGLGIMTLLIVRRDQPAIWYFSIMLALVLASKILIIDRQLSPEALLGAISAIIVLMIARRLPERLYTPLGIVLIGIGFAIFEFTPIPDAPYYPFNWIPFAGHMTKLSGLENILEMIWPFMAIACLVRLQQPHFHQNPAAVFAGLVVALLVFFAEWQQQHVAGRYGDLTQSLLALAGWAIPWALGGQERTYRGMPERRKDRRRR